MPSKAYAEFKCNLIDVDRLVNTHSSLNHSGGGRRGLGHITRSGVVMLCAAWETYAEDILVEAVEKISAANPLPTDLPLVVQQKLSRKVAGNKDELTVLKLAGDGWKNVLVTLARGAADGVNSPKPTVLDPLFRDYLGVEELSACWPCGADGIQRFVEVRGEIAHRGRKSSYIKISGLRGFRATICNAVVATDDWLATELKNLLPSGRKPWAKPKKPV